MRRMPSAGDGLSAQPSNAPQRYSPEHDDSEDDEDGGRHGHRHNNSRRRPNAADENAVMDDPMDEDDFVQQGFSDDDDFEEEEEEDDEEEESDDDDEDDDWDPSNATPAVKGRGNRRTSSRRVSAQIPVETSGAAAAAGNGPEEEEAASSGRRALGGNNRRRTLSGRRSGSVAPNPEAEVVEGPVLDDINLKRYAQGHQTRLTKLTVAVLKVRTGVKGHVVTPSMAHYHGYHVVVQ